MTPEELRIGNIIKFEDDSEDVVRVDWLFYNSDMWFVQWTWLSGTGTFKEGNSILIDFVPIPLTPEILLRCGFEFYSPLKHWRIVKDEQWYSISELKLSSGETILCFSWTNLAWDEGQSMPNKPVQYLHQLQNLYFAIAGQELTVPQTSPT